MVKNSFGGSGAKKMGRKFQGGGGGGGNRALRLVVDEDEMYASVTKMFGNGMCEVISNDAKKRLCVIRNKFRGRSKRDNTVAIGTWVMVGDRSWESGGGSADKLPKCDLLEVYNDGEKQKLKKINGMKLAQLAPDIMSGVVAVAGSGAAGAGAGEDEIEFSNADHSITDNIVHEIKQDINDGVAKKIITDDENNIVSIDDI